MLHSQAISLFRLAYRVVGTILSIIVLLLQSGPVQVVLHQDIHDNDDTITQLVVLHQEKYHTITVISTSGMIITTARRPPSSIVLLL